MATRPADLPYGQVSSTATTHSQTLTAWIAKEELRALLAVAKRGGQRHEISHRLWRFYTWCATVTTTPEVHALAATVEAWWPEIEAFLQLSVTNAATEGAPTGSSKPSRNSQVSRSVTEVVDKCEVRLVRSFLSATLNHMSERYNTGTPLAVSDDRSYQGAAGPQGPPHRAHLAR